MWLENEGYGRLQSTSSDRTLRKTCSVPSPYPLRTCSVPTPRNAVFRGFKRREKGATNCTLQKEGVQRIVFIDFFIYV